MRKAWALLIGICLTTSVFAASLTNLYTYTLPVANRTADARNTALSQAFSNMLVRLSGSSAVTSLPAVQTALQSPGNYLQEYAYVSGSNGTSDEVRFVFSRDSVNALLASAGQSIWGATRPVVLVWLVLKNDQGMKILNSGDSSSPVGQLELDAHARGLPLMLPMLDINDMQALSASELWQLQMSAVMSASARYVPDAVLVVRVDETDPAALSSVWLLSSNGQQQRFQITADNISLLVQKGVDAVSDSLASNYSVSLAGTSASSATLSVDGVETLDAYARVLKYLNQLTAVKTVSLQSAHNGQIDFEVTTHGDVTVLAREIALGSVLSRVKSPSPENANALVYQLRRI